MNLQTFLTTIIQQVYSQQMHFSVLSAKTGLNRLSGCPLAISHSCLVCSIDYFHRLDPAVTHRVLSCGPVQVRDLSESDSDEASSGQCQVGLWGHAGKWQAAVSCRLPLTLTGPLIPVCLSQLQTGLGRAGSESPAGRNGPPASQVATVSALCSGPAMT